MNSIIFERAKNVKEKGKNNDNFSSVLVLVFFKSILKERKIFKETKK
jgi:hypothetical protein